MSREVNPFFNVPDRLAEGFLSAYIHDPDPDGALKIGQADYTLRNYKNDTPVFIKHTPKYFTLVKLPFDFDPAAKCKMWLAFLERIIQNKSDYINLLQQWYGYLFRPLVITRRVTQGTRGQTGMCWCERIWTILATCKKQEQNIFDFMNESVIAHWSKQKYPLLIR
ncbi:MAG: hypothetical protein ACYS1A_02040 [Planctomycetota bacterium]|jgi:hypothetical protein